MSQVRAETAHRVACIAASVVVVQYLACTPTSSGSVTGHRTQTDFDTEVVLGVQIG